MREDNGQLAAIVNGSFNVSWQARFSRGDRELFTRANGEQYGVDVVVNSLTWDASGDVEASCSLQVLHTPADGASIIPESPSDLLAPFGSEVTLYMTVSAGPVTETIEVGVYRITKVREVSRDVRLHVGEWQTFAEVVDLELEDRMSAVIADRFVGTETVRNRESVWGELDRLVPFPVLESVADSVIPANTIYDDAREKVLQQLAALLQGVAYFNHDGHLTVRRPADDVTQTLSLSDRGTVIAVGGDMDPSRVYNGVAVTGKRQGEDGTEFTVTRWVGGGALAPDGPFGRKPYFYQSDFIYTNAQAAAEAERLLAMVSDHRGREVTAECILDPRTQVGDLIRIEGRGRDYTLRVDKISWGDSVMQVSGVTE